MLMRLAAVWPQCDRTTEMLLRLFEPAFLSEDVGKIEVRFFVVGSKFQRCFVFREGEVVVPQPTQNSAKTAMEGRVFRINGDGALHHARRDLETAGLLGNKSEPIKTLRMFHVDGENIEIELLRFLETAGAGGPRPGAVGAKA